MSTIHLHLTIQQMPSGRHVATVRREGPGIPRGLTRPFTERRDAIRWLVENTKVELTDEDDGAGEAA